MILVHDGWLMLKRE